MFQAHRPCPKRSLFLSNGHPKMKEKSGLRPRPPKNVTKAGQRAPKRGKGGAHWGPRVAQGLQNDSPNPPKIRRKTGSRSRCPPKGCQGYPRTPKITKIGRFFNIFGENIGGTVPKKRRAFRLVFYTVLVGQSEALYKKRRAKRGEHSVFFFLTVLVGKLEAGTKKRASIPSCFLNLLGDKLAGTVPPPFRLKQASNYCCFVLFYFYCFYIFLVRKRGQKHIALPNA